MFQSNRSEPAAPRVPTGSSPPFFSTWKSCIIEPLRCSAPLLAHKHFSVFKHVHLVWSNLIFCILQVLSFLIDLQESLDLQATLVLLVPLSILVFLSPLFILVLEVLLSLHVLWTLLLPLVLLVSVFYSTLLSLITRRLLINVLVPSQIIAIHQQRRSRPDVIATTFLFFFFGLASLPLEVSTESTRHGAIICSPTHDGLMHLDLSRSVPEQDWS